MRAEFTYGFDRVLISAGAATASEPGESGHTAWVQLEIVGHNPLLPDEPHCAALNLTKSQARAIGSALMGAAAEI